MEARAMTSDIELLPLPAHFAHQHDNVKKIVREYAIANMAELADDRDDLLARLDASIDHGTKLGAAQQRCLDEVLEQRAEIEALRGEVAEWKRVASAQAELHGEAEARAERLAEALRGIRDYDPVGGDAWLGAVELLQKKARAALRDHDQEGKDG